MNAHELEQEFLPSLVVRNSLLLFEAPTARRLVSKCFEFGLPFLGIEAFRLFENGGVQPSMEFSNISFGRVEERAGQLQVTSFERQLRSEWAARNSVCADTLRLIEQGAAAGYGWFEVSIEDPDSNELLFFRVVEAQQSAPDDALKQRASER